MLDSRKRHQALATRHSERVVVLDPRFSISDQLKPPNPPNVCTSTDSGTTPLVPPNCGSSAVQTSQSEAAISSPSTGGPQRPSITAITPACCDTVNTGTSKHQATPVGSSTVKATNNKSKINWNNEASHRTRIAYCQATGQIRSGPNFRQFRWNSHAEAIAKVLPKDGELVCAILELKSLLTRYYIF